MQQLRQDTEFPGEIVDRTTATRIEVERDPYGFLPYQISHDGEPVGALGAQALNVAGSPVALSEGATLEFGGDTQKRVTFVDNAGDMYAFIEILDR